MPDKGRMGFREVRAADGFSEKSFYRQVFRNNLGGISSYEQVATETPYFKQFLQYSIISGKRSQQKRVV